jgi:hypothetical protein
MYSVIQPPWPPRVVIPKLDVPGCRWVSSQWQASTTSEQRPCTRDTTEPRDAVLLDRLLLAVVAVRVRAAAVARVDVAGRGHVEGAVEVVARALAVELARAKVDVGGAVAVHP